MMMMVMIELKKNVKLLSFWQRTHGLSSSVKLRLEMFRSLCGAPERTFPHKKIDPLRVL